MSSFRLNPTRVRLLVRRVALCAIIALQGSVAFSSLLEAHEDRAPAAHMEGTGTRHLNVHNEATCMLCAARAMHAVPSVPETPELHDVRPSRYPALEAHEAPARVEYGSNPSRAPPQLS